MQALSKHITSRIHLPRFSFHIRFIRQIITYNMIKISVIRNKVTFHSKKLAEYMSIDLDGGKAFEISTVIGIYKNYLNEQQMSLDSYTTRRHKL